MRPVVLVLRLPHKIDPALRPAVRYLGALYSEIDTVGSLLDPSIRVGPVHFDGGSPPMLKREGTVELNRKFRAAFHDMPDVEISAEIDRYDMEAARFDALAQIGMTRVSLDLRYGQPHQTRASVEETMRQAMTLQPDRIALRLG